jgi:hypothetical protein
MSTIILPTFHLNILEPKNEEITGELKRYTVKTITVRVGLGGLAVIVLANGSKVHRFKPGRGRCIFKGNKILSTTSFGREVKPSAPSKILWHVKEPCGI